jgi:hypothetical protein
MRISMMYSIEFETDAVRLENSVQSALWWVIFVDVVPIPSPVAT